MGTGRLAKDLFIEKKPKTAKQMERHLKGIANHWRIEILLLIGDHPEITVDGIVEALDGNYSTLAVHTSKLVQAGLIEKKYRGKAVEHRLSPYGKNFVTFLKSLQHY